MQVQLHLQQRFSVRWIPSAMRNHCSISEQRAVSRWCWSTVLYQFTDDYKQHQIFDFDSHSAFRTDGFAAVLKLR